MTRRTLLKMVALIPLAGPTIAKALAKSECRPAVVSRCFPSHFPKWDKTLDGLESAGKWAMDIERSQLPRSVVFPRAGQIWEAVRDCEVSFHPCIAFPESHDSEDLLRLQTIAPIVLGQGAQLRQGERIRILETNDPKPIFVICVPVRYDELHDKIVPVELRKFPGYLGYKLHVKTAKTIVDLCQGNCQPCLNEAFRLVRDAA